MPRYDSALEISGTYDVCGNLFLMTVAKTELEQIRARLMIMSLTQFHSKYAFGVVAAGNHKALF